MKKVAQNHPKRAVIYTRVSTGRQAEEGLSLAAQEERCRQRAEDEGCELRPPYVERGVSGRRADRPELNRLLADLDEIDVLIIWKLDRFGRSNRDLQVNFDKLEAAGVELVSIKDNLDTSTAAGRLLRNVLSALAEFESDVIGERVSAARERGRALGLHNGRAPYGYRKGNPQGTDKGRLIPEPAEAEIVRRIFAEWVAGTSQYAITQRLNAEGVRPRSAREWSQGSVSQMLRNRTYAGGTREGEEECRCGHEAIIEPADFTQAQTLLGGRHQSGGPNRRTAAGHLFLGDFLRCGLCGSPMGPRTDKRQGYEVYKCQRVRSHGAGACQAPAVHREPLERGLVLRLTDRHLDVKEMIRSHEENVNRRIAEIGARRAESECAAIKTRETLARVKGHYQEGRLEPEDWAEQREELRDQRRAAGAEAERLRKQEKELRRTLGDRDAEQEVLEFLASLRESALSPIRDAETLDALRAGFRRIWGGFAVCPGQREGELILAPLTKDGEAFAWATRDKIDLPLPAEANTYQQGLVR